MLSHFIFILLARFVILFARYCAVQEARAYEERFPPLSDAEFVASCKPGIDSLVALKVRRILSDLLCVEYERIHPSSRLLEDLGAE